MRVPYLSLEESYQLIKPELIKGFERVLKSGNVILGEELQRFEKEYSDFSNSKYTSGVGNGLDALTISLMALGIGPGDEVLVPSNTYIASLISVSRVGATPVLVEPKTETFNLNPAKIEEKITKKTKAIMPVHLFGQVCEMDEIMKLSKKYKLFVVEDNAQSHGAKYKKKVAGGIGHINATSFYPGKNMGAIGDAGAITTNNKRLDGIVKMVRNYGSKRKYYNEVIGFNSRMDEIQAAFLRTRLKQIDAINKKKAEIASLYIKNLGGVGDITLPITQKGSTHVYHIFCVRTMKRDKLQKFLTDKGITTLIHYPVPPHLQKAYKGLGFKKGDFPIAEELASTSLSLPIFPEMSYEQLEYVITKIKGFYKSS